MGSSLPKRYVTSLNHASDTRPADGREASGLAVDAQPASFSRRNFLKVAGFSFAGTAAACTRAPVETAIPFLDQPEAVIPGRSATYASTCGACSAGCGVLVKVRDGRPVKLEGNPDHPVSRGGLCAVGQASILGLYDSHRLNGPTEQGRPVTWAAVDASIRRSLSEIRQNGGAVRFLTGTVHSPMLRWRIRTFLEAFPDSRHIIYDPLSASAIVEAHARTHGVRALPGYRFDRAPVVVSFDADFLGTWISPVAFTAGYRDARDPERAASADGYHVQVESRMTLTGSKADLRVCVAPSQVDAVLGQVALRLAGRAGSGGILEATTPADVAEDLLDDLANRLWLARGHSLVVCDSPDPSVQALCNFANHLLGNYGSTLDLRRPSYQKQGNDADLAELGRELAAGEVSALFVAGVNPVADLPGAEALAGAIRKVPLSVGFGWRPDETVDALRFVCPDHHPLESWGDAEPVRGVLGVVQPVLRPLRNPRAMVESLGVWMGDGRSARDVLQAYWASRIHPAAGSGAAFDAFWDQCLRDGFVRVPADGAGPAAFNLQAVRPVPTDRELGRQGLTLQLYPKVGMLDGREAHNPWLHELPDPVSKATWDNYACLSPAAAARLGVADGDVVRIQPDGGAPVELPALVQAGQHDQVVAVALGYGRRGTERFATIGPQWLEAGPGVGPNGRVGVRAEGLLSPSDGLRTCTVRGVQVTTTGRRQPIACTQSHHSLVVPPQLTPAGSPSRPIVQEIAPADPVHGSGSGPHGENDGHGGLWPDDHPYTGHHWGMVVDLDACTGCSACVIGCQAENNVPVVGKDEVLRRREMHWIRIDRYYAEDEGRVDVAHMPMMCQQCDNAPCETVCPVLATVHSREGLNDQVYNRCVGTRYCANNCPYKVRRFNWFDYPRNDVVQNAVLNPDVTVRSRGVMEKCSFCVQRIQEARIESRRTGRKLSDGDIQPACQQSCPARAITFGDMGDPESAVSHLMQSPRAYHVLGELNVRPSVTYLKIVRRRPDPGGGVSRG